ncbi:hypothetical protein M413DRAFT_441824 [Hebeloma cylindrosporum]|uniref:Uncharacterized protein n=1 Tax=Hebeloma cylindrosporum TaxID=76867 RepID=A0A0C3CN18_HEBCY|nr:hypothetical protein M413DRAFT_441824 [Hebeloma cylindrosporum h7]
MSTKPKSATKPLPLPDLLQDLAVLRSSGTDIAQAFNSKSTNDQGVNSPTPVDEMVSASSEFVQVSRAAIRLHDSGKIGSQGAKIEEVQSKYEAFMEGLQK